MRDVAFLISVLSNALRLGHSLEVKQINELPASCVTFRPKRSKKGPCEAMLGPATTSAVGIAHLGACEDATMKFTILSCVALSAPSNVSYQRLVCTELVSQSASIPGCVVLVVPRARDTQLGVAGVVRGDHVHACIDVLQDVHLSPEADTHSSAGAPSSCNGRMRNLLQDNE